MPPEDSAVPSIDFCNVASSKSRIRRSKKIIVSEKSERKIVITRITTLDKKKRGEGRKIFLEREGF